MTFNPTKWYPIAVVLSVLNVVSVWFTAGSPDPWHPALHAAAALGFGLWAQRLRQRRGVGAPQDRLEALEAEVGRLEALEGEVSRLRQELSDAQERLDFFERVLAKGAEARRVGPER
jgi:hypothetical protein